MWSADLLILFGDEDGIYTDNPKTNKNAEFISTVSSIPELREKIKIGGTSSFGTGGVETKIQAAQKVTEYGIQMMLANGKKENALSQLLQDDATGTLFLA